MKYQKLEITSTGAIRNKKETKTLGAIKKAYSMLKKDFAEGTNSMADDWIKCDQKAKKIKDGTIAMSKNISYDLKKSFKGISPKIAVCDISYELGGAIKKTKEVFNEYIDDITRIPYGK